ncbi:hypothetical protein VPHD63_0010 [Vibrio phage D63]
MAPRDYLKQVTALLKDRLSVPVYSGEIPESQENTAVMYQNVANPHERVVEGQKTKFRTIYRLTVVAVDDNELESVLEDLEDLDGSRNADFQKIWTTLVLREPGLIKEPYRRAFVDMTLYI